MIDSLLREREDVRLPGVLFKVQTDPDEIFWRLYNSPLQDLVLGEGESLSLTGAAKNHEDFPQYPDIELTASTSTRHAVGIRAYAMGVFPEGDALEWDRSLDIVFFYGFGENSAIQYVRLSDRSGAQDDLPSLSRRVIASKYQKVEKYEGHRMMHRHCKNEGEAEFFIDVIRDLQTKPRRKV